MNKFEQVISDDHQMSLVGRAGAGETLYGEVQCILGMWTDKYKWKHYLPATSSESKKFFAFDYFSLFVRRS